MSKILLFLLFIFLSFLIFYSPNLYRLYKLANLYNEDKISRNFINMEDFFNTSNPIPASKSPYVFEKSLMDLPETYTFEGQELNLNEGLKYFNTDGLIILHDDKVLYEQYWNGNDQHSKHISWSVAKSFLSALIGIEFDIVSNWALRKNIPHTTYRNLSENEEVQNLIWEEIKKSNEYTSSLPIRKFRMLTKELDHEDGDLTATQKAKRNVIMEKFSDLIEDMYK